MVPRHDGRFVLSSQGKKIQSERERESVTESNACMGTKVKKSGEGGVVTGKSEVESCDWLRQPVQRWGPLCHTDAVATRRLLLNPADLHRLTTQQYLIIS